MSGIRRACQALAKVHGAAGVGVCSRDNSSGAAGWLHAAIQRTATRAWCSEAQATAPRELQDGQKSLLDGTSPYQKAQAEGLKKLEAGQQDLLADVQKLLLSRHEVFAIIAVLTGLVAVIETF